MAKKKQRKPMSPQAKRNLINVFKSIISNEAAMDGAKEAPSFIAFIFLLLSICLPLIPIMTTVSSYYGSSFVATYNYGADQGLAATTKSLKADGYEFKVSGGLMSFYQNGQEAAAAKRSTPEAVATHTLKDGNNEYYNFMFYITDVKGADFDAYVSMVNAIQYESGTLTPRSENLVDIERYERDGTTFYIPSYIILGKDTMGVQLYKYNSCDPVIATYRGLDWNNTNTSERDLLSRVADLSNKKDDQTETEVIFNNWKSVFNETYENQKWKTMWIQTGIYAGVYAGLILFLGLMIFIITRGKTNPNRTINFFVALKISWWTAFTPALLGMILGFIFAGNTIGQMAFIVLLSIRVMWLTMRKLTRPM